MKRTLILCMVMMLASTGVACTAQQEVVQQENALTATAVIEATAQPTASDAPATDVGVDTADYERLQTLLVQIATDYQPGSAGCSLRAVKLAGQLLDWNAENAPERTRVTETMDIASKLVTSVTPQEFGEQFNDIHSAAIELTKDYALSYMESAGYTPSAYPYDAATVETFFSALRAGLGGEAIPFLTSIDSQQPFAMDMDGDGTDETVTVLVDEDKYTTDLTIEGITKTYTDHLDTALMFTKAYVGGAWPGNDGQTLFLYGDEASDDYTTHIYRVRGGELQHGEIYGSPISASADGFVMINTVVDVFGTYGANCQYRMNDDFTFTRSSAYAIDSAEGVANGRKLTVICDGLSVVSEDGAKTPSVLPKGAELLLTETDQETYALLANESGALYRVQIEKHDDDWQWYIDGRVEEQCFDPLLYAG